MTDENTTPPVSRLSWRDIGCALRYPARRGPLLFLALASLCLTVKPLGEGVLGLWPPLLPGMRLPLALASGVLGLGALVLLPKYLGDTLRCAAQGGGLPGRPRLSELQSMIVPALKMLAVLLWSFLPVLLYLAAFNQATPQLSLPLVLVLFAIVSFYLPMALLLQVITGKLWPPLLPSNVIDPIVRTFPGYWRAWLLMLACVLFLPGSALLSWVPVAGSTLATFAGLYLFAGAMHALGRFYRLEAAVLDWKIENGTAPAGHDAVGTHQG